MLSRGGRVPSGVSPKASSILHDRQTMLRLVELEGYLPSIRLIEIRPSCESQAR